LLVLWIGFNIAGRRDETPARFVFNIFHSIQKSMTGGESPAKKILCGISNKSLLFVINNFTTYAPE